ncbi:hypothetical protein MA16_Dca012956 [Dendrobium catenatum]|uniref:Uncharacterized protein n=1 Tax=Dendrobium catenatum TaxID=906689 RepID=A0A2I0W1T5_9ASPA|nr:hypothetical protein MA16_Dca012956 [Dendrobium catenatum]
MVLMTSINIQRSFRPQSPVDYGLPDLRLLLWSFRPPLTDNGLSDPGLLPTTVLPTKRTCICNSCHVMQSI